MAEVTITVPDPDLAAALAAFGAIVLIDIAAIRLRKATISRWVRHQYRHRPAVMVTATAALLVHLAVELRFDPAGWVARRVGVR